MLAILSVANAHRQRAFVLTFIIMYEDGWYVNAIGARHAVFAIVAGNILKAYYLLGYLLVEIAHLIIRQRNKWTVGEEVILQMLHIGHSAEYTEHTLWGSCIAESP